MAKIKRGITIELDANTDKFNKAINNATKTISKIDREMRKVDKALKFNPKSVDLWKQKQTLLNQKITETQTKLDNLKNLQKSMDAKGVDKNSEAYRKVQREIVETQSKLKRLKAEMRNIGEAHLRALGERFKELGRKAEEAGKVISQKVTAPIVAAYTASAKVALDYGDAIAKVSTISDSSQVSIDELRKGILDLSNATGKGATELAEASYQALSASVETKDVLGFVSEASNLAKAGFLDTADAVDVLTTVINAYGMNAEDANKIANELIQTQNDGKTTVNELAQAMGTVIPTASALNIPLEQLNASYVLMTKQGINTANATTYLNGMFTELADGGSDVSEILQNKTGKTFGQLMKDGATLGDVLKTLNESVDGDSEAFLNLWGNTRAGRGALSILNGGIEEFNDEVIKMEGSTGNVEDALSKLATPASAVRKALNEVVNAGIQIGTVLAPYIEKGAKFVQGLVERFNELSPRTKEIIVTIGAIVGAIGPLLLVGGKLLTGVGSLLIGAGKVISLIQTLIPLFGMIVTAIGPVGVAFLAISAVIGAVALAIYKNWDKIKVWATQLASRVSEEWNRLKANTVAQFNAIKTAIVTPIQNAIDKVKGIIQKIKSFFPINIGKVMSGIKLPHFKLTGKFSLKDLTVPKLSVDWYKKGGIFDSPSVIGVGEAGSEAVVPLDKFWDKLDKLHGETNIVININGADGNAREIAQEVKRMLIQETNRQRLAWT